MGVIEVMFNKKIDVSAPIHEMISKRWSGRAYDADKMLARIDIISLLEAARWAPSCSGIQPWRFIVCDKASNKSSWIKALDCLSEGNRDWAQYAPLLLLSCADSKGPTNNINRWGKYDTGAASENLCLQATVLGLMTHQMGGFDMEKARNSFNIPIRYIPMAMISIGYQLTEDKIPENMRDREYSKRERNLLDVNFFEGSWETPVVL